jgi:hypothetical protein
VWNDLVLFTVEKGYFGQVRDKFSNVRIKALPADAFTVFDVMSKALQLRKVFPFEMLVVDYDANIKETIDNMYESHGVIYANLKSYSTSRWATLVGSQVKISAWQNEIIKKEDAAESSKKQHHVDMMIGIGRNPDVPIIGTLNIAKMRRGMSDVQTRLQLELARNKITEIDATQYEYLVEAWKQAKTGKGKGSIVDFDEIMENLQI